MSSAIVVYAAPAEARRAASWLSRSLIAAGFAPRAARRTAARMEAGWSDLTAALFPREGRAQMILLSVSGAREGLAVELSAERSGRLPAALSARAAALGLDALEPREGLQRFRLCLAA